MSPFPANQKSSWLVAYPQSGTGTATVNLVLSAAGLASGVYTANLVFQSVNTIPQFVNVPVTFTIGASSSVVISGVTNGASFVQTFAPGMILSIFGSRLANSTKAASSVPLPATLDGVSVTVNGVNAPLYFISPGQLNTQIPYETPVGTAVLGVNNNGLVNSFTFPVKATAPGIFTGNDGAIVPISSARRSQSILLYITGDGETAPTLNTGAPPANSTPLSGLPAPRAALTMSVGGIAVTPFFVGIPYGLVGVTQINFTVPANAPLGIQPVIVSVGGVAGKTASLNITPAAVTAESVPPLFPAAGFLPLPVLPLELSRASVSVGVSGEERDVPQKQR
jgi:adhesin/invasin